MAKDVVMPRDLPAYGADKPLPVPDIEKKTLANGLEVWVLPRDGVPRVDYVLAVRGAGYAADDAPGFASMLAGLLAEGSDRHDSKQIAEAAQGYGGSVGANASRSEEHTSELQSLMRNSYAVFCLQKKTHKCNN